ncbi:MAG: glucose-1-phosphate thymidylyltransferase [Deltaproteobacteria bacterium]|nr:glucose-1-phosphate thymidylyltransferase [Deltaproteobacteria bacterium]
MKGLVLCGGKGTRLRPLTHTAAKQLVPVANRPILFYVLDNLSEAGVRDIGIIVSPETGDAIRDAVGSGERWGLRVEYLLQEKPLGLAHAVKLARPFLGLSPFVMYCGDNLIGGGIKKFCEDFERNNSAALILLKQVNNPSSFGVAEIDDKGRVMRLVEKPKDPKSDLALVGVYFLSPKIHSSVQEIRPSQRGELEITDALQRLLDGGERIASYTLQGWWLDTGKKDDLLAANTTVLDEWAKRRVMGTVDEESSVIGRVVTERGSCVRRSTVRGPVIVGGDVTIENSFVGPFTSIGSGSRIVNSVIEHSVILPEASIENVDRLEDSLIGRGSRVFKAQGTHHAYRLLVGDDSVIGL